MSESSEALGNRLLVNEVNLPVKFPAGNEVAEVTITVTTLVGDRGNFRMVAKNL